MKVIERKYLSELIEFIGIDLLYVLNNSIYPIEVKKGQQPQNQLKILMSYLNMVLK